MASSIVAEDIITSLARRASSIVAEDIITSLARRASSIVAEDIITSFARRASSVVTGSNPPHPFSPDPPVLSKNSNRNLGS